MAIDDIKVRSAEACKGALDGLIDPWGGIVKFGARNTADFSHDEIVFAWKRFVGIFVGRDQGLAYPGYLVQGVVILRNENT